MELGMYILLITTGIVIDQTGALTFIDPVDHQTTVISESTQPGDVVHTVILDDFTATMHIASTTPTVKFREMGSQITMFFSIDYETEPTTYYLTLVAYTGSASATVTLEIKVSDVDEAPEFSGTFSASMDEMTMTGPIGALSYVATDPEGGSVSYQFMPMTGNFAVDSTTGVISLVRMIDYEAGLTSFSFDVTALDNNLNANIQTFTLTINDINDNSPIFSPSTYQTTIPENTAAGHNVMQVTASDADVTSTVTISIQSGDDVTPKFTMSSDTIQTTSTPIVYSTLSGSGYEYTLIVVASDGTNTGTATVTVTITASNVAPVWTTFTPAYVDATTPYTVSENDVSGTSVLTIAASDSDTGVAGQITYSLTDPVTANTGATESGLFTVHSTTGELTTASALDRDTATGGYEYYDVTVTASDQATSPLSVTRVVRIGVSDYNDNAPVFSQSSYTFSVSESAASSTSVGDAVATDSDLGSNAVITYTIASFLQGGTHFTIHSTTGAISTSTALDRETDATYEIEITGTDGGSPQLTGTTTVTINVGDENDNAPSFSAGSYSGSTTENDSIGTGILTVTVADADTGTNANIVLSIDTSTTAGVTADTFIDVSSATSIVSVKANIDREAHSGFNFDLIATDQGSPALSTTVAISITVSNVNDNTPTFSPSTYQTTIPENTAAGHNVMQVTASDSDVTSTVTISIQSGDDVPPKFTMSSDTIQTTSTPIDYDTLSGSSYEYALIVVANDGTFEGTATVTVTISGVNDNTPVWTTFTPAYVDATTPYTVSENDASGTSVLTIAASDSDDGVDGQITYSLSDPVTTNTGASESGLFTVHSTTGELTTASTLDRDTATGGYEYYDVTVTASDQATSPLSVTRVLRIGVSDYNDNAPVFTTTSPLTINLSELASIASTVTTVVATDADSSTNNNNQIAFSFSASSSYFAIGSSSGVVTVTSSLDREMIPSHSLVIYAIDQGSPQNTGSMSLTVSLTDENDNAPVFSQSSYTFSVSESAASSTSVGDAVATDSDLGSNAVITYTIASFLQGGTHFTIHSTTGAISTSTGLDRETDATYEIEITGTDGGSPQLTGTTTVTINVGDENDNAPSFSAGSYSGSTTENDSIGTSILTVTVADADTGANANIVLSIDTSTTAGATADTFIDVSSATSIVSVKANIDREAHSGFNFDLIATDQGSPALSTTVAISITVSNINDNTPTFSPSTYQTTIPENTAAGQNVMQVTASDSDVTNTVTLSIQSGDDIPPKFTMSSDTIQTTSTPIDYDTLSGSSYEYTLIVVASDGTFEGTATVTVTISGVNDNTQVWTTFTPAYVDATTPYTVSENDASGTSVLTIAASDSDAGVDGQVTYSLTDPVTANTGASVSGLFTVHSTTGELTTASTLDRDTATGGYEYYDVTVTASDQATSPLSITRVVRIGVSDYNDNAPVFTTTGPLTINLSESASIASTVTTVAATDADSSTNNNNQIAFSFSASSPYFAIGSSSGVVTVTSSLDREMIPSHSLVIYAIDQGSPQNTGSMSLTVSLTDENDNAPVFSQSSYTFSVSESAASSTSVGDAVATDSDLGSNAVITYTIASFLQGGTRFTIHSTTGAISTSTGLDRETDATYEIEITGTDGGSPQLTGTTTVTINVGDENDNAPSFSAGSYSGSTTENDSIGTGILTVTVADADTGANANVVLSIDTSTTAGATADTFIDVNSATSIVSVKANIDRETHSVFNFDLIASDQGSPALSTTVAISITVNDINDNQPVFSSTFYNTEIAYDSQCQGTVATISATDADIGVNGDVTFTMSRAYNSSLFSLSATSGDITLINTTEVATKYVLYVMASDGGTPVLNATTEAIIRTDTFDANDVILNYHMDINCTTYLTSESTFLAQLTDVYNDTYPTCYARRWCYVSGDSAPSCIVRVYVIVNDTADEVTELTNTKYFLHADDAFSVTAADSTGTPASVITGAAWSAFSITQVEKYSPPTESGGGSSTSWIETPIGIGVAAGLSALVALSLATGAALRICGNTSNSSTGSQLKQAPSWPEDDMTSRTSLQSSNSSGSNNSSMPRVSIVEDFTDTDSPYRAQSIEPGAERASVLESRAATTGARVIQVETAATS